MTAGPSIGMSGRLPEHLDQASPDLRPQRRAHEHPRWVPAAGAGYPRAGSIDLQAPKLRRAPMSGARVVLTR
jgi:hypothetical protein